MEKRTIIGLIIAAIIAFIAYRMWPRKHESHKTAISQNETILYYFYSPHCGYCKMFKPVWDKVSKDITHGHGVRTIAIDATDPANNDIAFYYNINAYPTIILVTPNKNYEYTGNRSYEDIERFVSNAIY